MERLGSGPTPTVTAFRRAGGSGAGGAPSAEAERLCCGTASRYIRALALVGIYVVSEGAPTRRVISTSPSLAGWPGVTRKEGPAPPALAAAQEEAWLGRTCCCCWLSLVLLAISRMLCSVAVSGVMLQTVSVCLTVAEKGRKITLPLLLLLPFPLPLLWPLPVPPCLSPSPSPSLPGIKPASTAERPTTLTNKRNTLRMSAAEKKVSRASALSRISAESGQNLGRIWAESGQNQR